MRFWLSVFFLNIYVYESLAIVFRYEFVDILRLEGGTADFFFYLFTVLVLQKLLSTLLCEAYLESG
jgi:hypothetical protein